MNRMMERVFRFPETQHASQIKRATDYIEAHCAEKLNLADVAARAFLTPAYFGRVFRRETGSGFSDYVNRVRIEKSKEYLRRGETRLTDIAQMTGFEDQSYFTKVFKRVEGVSPDRYRKRLLAPPEKPTKPQGARA
jgi:YesN/AraC family two-component response regulator